MRQGRPISGDIIGQLHEMLQLPAETEWIEFKEAKNDYGFDKIGKYFSALSNEANLNRKSAGWLIFGVTDKPPREIVGSNYRNTPPGLDRLKKEIAQHTNHQMTFIDIHTPTVQGKRVVMFEIPPAAHSIPTTWNGVAYGRIHESCGPLSLHEIDRIREQSLPDWSAEICDDATMNNLDSEAISFARAKYKEKHQDLATEVDEWDDTTFLNKAKVCINGKITNTAIILLGKSEAGEIVSPAIAPITWVLKDDEGFEIDYAHFYSPLILAVEKVFEKIRNLTVRHMSGDTLFPIEATQYDPWVIREALHNCIAHQDYRQSARITVTERTDSLMFTNRGEFIPGTVLSIIERDTPPDRYRNPFLTNAMVELNMIDTIGSGIKRMFKKQRDRYFPMPDYDFSEENRVKVAISGRIIDEKYTRILIQNKDLELMDVIALDKVQKGHSLSNEERSSLKTKKLVEGRYPNLYVSKNIAAATDTKAEYIKNRSFDKQHFKDMVIGYLEEFDEAKRKDIDALLMDKVSDALDSDQKRKFIQNLLQEMRREDLITVVGRTNQAKWVLLDESIDCA